MLLDLRTLFDKTLVEKSLKFQTCTWLVDAIVYLSCRQLSKFLA